MKHVFFVFGLALILQVNALANEPTHTTAPTAAAKVDCSKDENYPEVSKAELSKMVEEKSAFVVDVNSVASFKEEHVPGAVHFKAAERKFASVLPKDKNATIVAYCGGPQCTAWKKAAEQACKLGYTNIKHFKDGISGWKKKS